MGTVFEATHVLSKKTVALKILNPAVGRDETTRQRFLREVAAPAQIGHDGIVEIYDAGFDPGEGSLFVAMELLTGDTMRERLARGGMTQEQVLDLFDQLLQPLAAAHRAGIVHRDLKPENVFLHKKRDGHEVVKVLDFGIARDLAGQDTVTQAGTAMGTPHYMSPEQAMSARDVTFTTDVWALGIMLYEALSGAPPFAGETIATVVVEICTKPHRPLAEVTRGVSAAIAALVDRCLDKDATKRPRDAGEMWTALRQARGALPGPRVATSDLAALPSTLDSSLPSSFSTSAPTASARTGSLPTAPMQMPSVPGTAAPSSPGMFSPPSVPYGSAGATSPMPAGGGGSASFATPSAPVLSPPPPYVPPSGAMPGLPSTPGLASTPGAPAPAARPWLWPLVIVSGVGCLGILGLGVLISGLAILGSLGAAANVPDVDGTLAYGDSYYPGRGLADTYEYSFDAGERVVLSLDSPDFDTYLVVRAPSGREMFNDDSGFGNLNSRLEVVMTESGTYQVVVTSYSSGVMGRYHLHVGEP